jgi:surfeit locus 1 family protein
MRWRTAGLLLAGSIAAVACVRLGLWQLSRWHEKRATNARTSAALAASPVALADTVLPADLQGGRRVALRGRFDESRQVLLLDRSRGGSPGVEVVTPLILAGGAAVLVDRGWLEAPDGATAWPPAYSEPAARTVVGLVEPLRPQAPRPWRRVATDSMALWSTGALDPDSLRPRFPYPVAAFTVRELPGAGVPTRPARLAPEPPDETMHLSYAVQWFLFAAAAAGGSIFLATRRTHRPTSP